MPPESTEQLLDEAYAAHEAGRLDEAARIYQEVLKQQPDDSDAMQLLGVLYLQQGWRDKAREMLERSAQIDPDAPDCHYHLGVIAAEAGDHEKASREFAEAGNLRGDFPEAFEQLGRSLQKLKRWKEAAEAHQRAILLRPNSVEEYLHLANALRSAGDLQEAVATYQRVLDLEPRSYSAAYSLGFVLRQMDCWDDSIAAYRKALEQRWGDVAASNNLAAALKDSGQLDEAIQCFDQAISTEPENAAVASNRLFVLHFHPAYDPADLLEEHLHWNEKYARALGKEIQSHTNDRSPDRKLKIGYISGDFRQHPVGLAIEPVIDNRDQEKFEAFCFSTNTIEDAATERIAAAADHWEVVAKLSDEKLAERVRDLGIDILVDLSLHMGANRMLTFARKPAPVQVTYLGYPGTTGLSTMDYRISDPWIDPPGTDDFYSEKTIRLPKSYLCWRWNGGDVPLTEPPVVGRRQITFGSLNNFCKVTLEVLHLWGELMAIVPESRLILRAPPGETAQRVRSILSGYGVAETRVTFTGRLPWDEYVRLTGHLDIALDPFPYPGHTTSLDALWMGVPVVTLAGNTAASRGGASILHNIGLPELIAADERQYLAIAAELAGDIPRLKELRKTLRDRLRNSPIMDEKTFARDIESAYRQMWRNWCASPS
jgi:protein O-GlcNAc transferase